MALKKYDKTKEEEKVVETALGEQQIINARIEANKELEEQLKSLPLDEQEDLLKENINKSREVYVKWSKFYKKWNLVLSSILIAILVVFFVLIFMYGTTIAWLGYLSFAIIIADLGVMWFISKWQRKKLGDKAEIYLNEHFNLANLYIYSDESFEEKQTLCTHQIDNTLFFDAHFYQNLKGTKSRNVFFAKYRDKKFIAADLAAFVLIKNRTSPMFLGKFYQLENSYAEENKYILFQLKGGEYSRPIDDVESDDISLVEGNDIYAIYSNDNNWRKVFNRKVIDELRKFNIDSTLIDVLVSVRKGTTVIAIDYSDEFINVPINSVYNAQDTRRAKQDLIKVMQIFDLIDKTPTATSEAIEEKQDTKVIEEKENTEVIQETEEVVHVDNEVVIEDVVDAVEKKD